MAVGGWSHYRWVEYETDGSNTSTAARMAELEAFMLTMTGWESDVGISSYLSSSAWWWSIKHTATGARIVFAKCGDYNTIGPSLIDGSNYVSGAAVDATGHEGTFLAAYLPPSLSSTAFGSANPGEAGFLPSGATKFGYLSGNVEIGNTLNDIRNTHHILVRGNGMIYLFAQDTQDNGAIDYWNVMGECLTDLYHASHPTYPDDDAEAAYAHITKWGPYPGSDGFAQFFSHDHTLLTAQFSAKTCFLFHNVILKYACNNQSPWNWQDVTVCRDDTDLDTYGVIPGNGLKGLLNHEWVRVMCLGAGDGSDYNTSLAFGELVDGGNFIHVRGGLVIGWDPTNGSLG